MIIRILEFAVKITTKYPRALLAVILLLSVLSAFNIPRLQLGTSLTDLYNFEESNMREINHYLQNAGFGNHLYGVIETENDKDSPWEEMEIFADRLTEEMLSSGKFKSAACSLEEKEILRLIQFYSWNFPSFIISKDKEKLKALLTSEKINESVARGRSGFVTPFSSLLVNSFVSDPLGLLETVPLSEAGLPGLSQFDLEWGSGGYFYSKDHKALLIIARPLEPSFKFEFAGKVVHWTRALSRSLLEEHNLRKAGLNFWLAGGYVYAEQDKTLIKSDITRVSIISTLGVILLFLLVVRKISIIVISLIPLALSIIGTTGLISIFPGKVNLISLSFIAILVGLGIDHALHFISRIGEELNSGASAPVLLGSVLRSTGRSIFYCLLTSSAATLSLALSSFNALAEFGIILSFGLLMLLIHNIFTLPAIIMVWWGKEGLQWPADPFRFLPDLLHASSSFVKKYKFVLAALTVVLASSAAFVVKDMEITKGLSMERSSNNPAVTGQIRLAEIFGLEEPEEIILIHGKEKKVLSMAEKVTDSLGILKKNGYLKSLLSLSAFLPSESTQRQRAGILNEVDILSASEILRKALAEKGFNLQPFEPVLNRLTSLGEEDWTPLSLKSIYALLPEYFYDSLIVQTGKDHFIAAVMALPSGPKNAAILHQAIQNLSQKHPSVTIFSFSTLNENIKNFTVKQSKKAIFAAALGILLVVFICFRKPALSILSLIPCCFSVLLALGIMTAFDYEMSFMTLAALPLVIGIGIDDGIHIIHRFIETGPNDFSRSLNAIGAPITMTSLTTMIGFGALLFSNSPPLVELGLVTTIGISLALIGSFWVLPSCLFILNALSGK